MAHKVDISAKTGPGKQVHLVLGDVNEIAFKFNKKVLEVLTKDGNLGMYDLEDTGLIRFTREDKFFSIVVSEEKDDVRTPVPESTPAGKAIPETGKPAEAPRQK